MINPIKWPETSGGYKYLILSHDDYPDEYFLRFTWGGEHSRMIGKFYREEGLDGVRTHSHGGGLARVDLEKRHVLIYGTSGGLGKGNYRILERLLDESGWDYELRQQPVRYLISKLFGSSSFY